MYQALLQKKLESQAAAAVTKPGTGSFTISLTNSHSLAANN